MSPGGMIMSHDYPRGPGVKKAFDEFFKNKSEPVMQALGAQCFVTKL